MSYVENQYKTATILESIKNFVNLKQKCDEELVDYIMRFKSAAREIVRSHIGGRLPIKKLAETHTGSCQLLDQLGFMHTVP